MKKYYLLFLFFLLLQVRLNAQDRIYWAEDDCKIYSSDKTGPHIGYDKSLILTTSSIVNDIEIDYYNNDMYWSEGNSVKKAKTDGTGLQILQTLPGENIGGIALDLMNDKLFFNTYDGSSIKIYRSNLDGTGQAQIKNIPIDLGVSKSLSISYTLRKLYWVQKDDLYYYVMRCNPDGSTVETLMTTYSALGDVAIDDKNQKLYLSYRDDNVIKVTDMRCSTLPSVLYYPVTLVKKLVVDNEEERLYYSENVINRIGKCSLDGVFNEMVLNCVSESATAIAVPSLSPAPTIFANETYTFALKNFLFADVNKDLTQIIITSPVGKGTMYLDIDGDNIFDAGEAVLLNHVVLKSSIDAGYLKYKPAPNEAGLPYTTFGFKWYYGSAYSATEYQQKIYVKGIKPIVYTQSVTDIKPTTVSAIGDIALLGAPVPTAHGICWNTTGNPTITDSKVNKGAASSTGTFTASLTGLTPNTTYFYRAYVTNDEGTVYGEIEHFSTDYKTIYVDASKTDDAGNGLSWATAKKTLQAALDLAVSGKEIWVKAGTYNPTSDYGWGSGTNPRLYHFRMKDDIAIYGGFAGTETAVNQRTSFGVGQANETKLSGDVGVVGDNSDNCCHVFYHPNGTNLTSTAILDGFTISDGNANDPLDLGDEWYRSGGGMYNETSSPVIRNTTFIFNNAKAYGGAIYNLESSPVLDNVIISNNTANRDGGGICNAGSNLILTNSIITNNSANGGGGIFQEKSSTNSNSEITNVLIKNNSSSEVGGGIFNGEDCTLSLTNATITNNSSVGGGGFGAYQATTTFNNCILWGNIASESGNQINIEESTTILNYSCYSNGVNDVHGSVTATNHNITSDPLFGNPANGDFRLYSNSPCIDAGNDSYISELYDIRGNVGRKLNKADAAVFGTVDMGAYEHVSGTDPVGITPTVTSVYFGATGLYKAGYLVYFTVYFNSVVNVVTTGGTPYIPITLNEGGTVRASYVSGSGTNSLAFYFTVADGANDPDGITLGSAIIANGGTIKNSSNFDANLTFNNVPSTANVRVDAVSPTITKVSSTAADGTYKMGDIIDITLLFSEPVYVTGSPTLALNSGGLANYYSGSGTSTLTFRYTVGINDSSADLDYQNYLSLNTYGGSIKDEAGNSNLGYLPSIGSSNSLGKQKNIVVICKPWIQGEDYEDITDISATIKGRVRACNSSSIVVFEYGLTTSYGSSVVADLSPVSGNELTTVRGFLTGLIPNTNYHFRIKATNEAGTSFSTYEETFTTEPAASSKFTGTGNWSDVARWSAGIPGTTTDATIDGTCTATEDYEVDSLIISSGKMTINPDMTLMVNGAVINNVGSDALLLKSDASGTGKLVNNSSNVPATVQQYFVKGQWHYYTLPTSASVNVYPLFYRFWAVKHNESTNDWTFMNSDDILIPGVGYGAHYNNSFSNDTVVSISGNLNTGDITVNRTGASSGFSLIGNPYSCTVDWTTGINKTGAFDAIYVWNPVSGKYGTYIDGVSTNGQTQNIAPMQGFFVYGSSTSSVIFTNATKTTTPSYFRSADINQFIRLSVKDQLGKSDETVVRIKDGATTSFDGGMDAYKLISAESLTPQLWSDFKGEEYAVNTVPDISENMLIPLKVMPDNTGIHEISLSELKDYDKNLPIYVYDENFERGVNVVNGSYSFTAEAGKIVNLYVSFTQNPTALNEITGLETRLLSGDNVISISGMTGKGNNVKIYNVDGKMVKQDYVVGSRLDVSVASDGLYIVRIVSDNGKLFSGKVVVK
jgi:hypothetical protein